MQIAPNIDDPRERVDDWHQRIAAYASPAEAASAHARGGGADELHARGMRKLQAEREAEQRAKDAARETEERLKREAAAKLKQEADELAKREANKRHVNGIRAAAEAALVNGGLSVNQAAKAIELIDAKKIPHVAISY